MAADATFFRSRNSHTSERPVRFDDWRTSVLGVVRVSDGAIYSDLGFLTVAGLIASRS